MHARVILVEEGDTVSAPCVIVGASYQRVVTQTRQRMRSLMESTAGEADEPVTLTDRDIAKALLRGRWFTELDDEIVTVMVLKPQAIDMIESP